MDTEQSCSASSYPATSTNVRLEGELESSEFGRSIDTSPGSSSDGLVVGAPNAHSGDGKAYWIPGGYSSGTYTAPAGGQDFCAEDIHERLGFSVASGSDVVRYDGGLPEVFFGAPDAKDSYSDEVGRAYMMHGETVDDLASSYSGCHILSYASGTTDADLVLQGDADGDNTGFSVDVVGDLNQDGEQDLVVGAPYHDFDDGSATRTNGGSAYVILSSH